MFMNDNWLYLRIYTGFNTADQILLDVLSPRSRKMIAYGHADRWFFIRYANPDFHLRYRIRMVNSREKYAFTDQINDALAKFKGAGIIWKLESAEYLPEKERYGEYSIGSAEQIFYHDSEAFVSFLGSQTENLNENSRWLFAMASANVLLNDFGFTLHEKKALLLQLNRSFGNEFNKNKQLAKQLSGRFREAKEIISSVLDENVHDEYKWMKEILYGRSVRMNDSVRSIQKLYEEDQMEMSKSELLSSLIHMIMNRIFKNNNRLHEMVLYDYMFRYYKGLEFGVRSSELPLPGEKI